MKKIASRVVVGLIVLVGIFLLVVSIEPNLIRGQARDAISTSGVLPPGSANKQQATLTTSSPTPPQFVLPSLPPNYRRLDGARHASDEMYVEWLENEPRTGPTPRNIGELGFDSKMEAKRKEFGNTSELDYRLRLLDAIDACVKQAGVVEGSVAAVFWFKLGTNVARPSHVTYEATTLPPTAMEAATSCINQAHATSTGFTLKPEAGVAEHVWPSTITVPVRNHELYHWLDADLGTPSE